jgi:hypothetical protein
VVVPALAALLTDARGQFRRDPRPVGRAVQLDQLIDLKNLALTYFQPPSTTC